MAVQGGIKRRRNKSPPLRSSIVDEVPSDILKSVFNKLSFDDLVKAKSVCSSWKLIGEDLVSRMPRLMHPSRKQVEEGDGTDVGYSAFLNLGENRVYNLKTVPKELSESCCIGSSDGCLIFLEDKAVPFLFNPFKQVKNQLPSVDHLLGLKKMERKMDGEYELGYEKDNGRFRFKSCGKPGVRECFIQKAILTRKQDNNNGNYGVVLLCNNSEEIVYHESGDKFWTVLDANHPPYHDIICHGNYLYALSDENSIEHVDELKWVEMECLGDRALFLGGNQSVSISAQCFPNYEKNSIYFSDDCWEKMLEDSSYGGQDMGIFNLKDGSLKPIVEFSSGRIQPPPCWIIPPDTVES